MKLPEDIAALAREAIEALAARKLTIATVESCTGGLVASALTSISGSSEVVYGGFVTYANEAKIGMVGVPFGLLREHGAVSEAVAVAMAEGALATAGTHLALAITGIAGPGGGSAEKPVGLVHFALAREDGTTHVRRVLAGLDRDGVRHQSVLQGLRMIIAAAS